MARIRSIKPEFFKNWKLFQLEIDTSLPIRVAFSGLWTVADREGRFKWIPQQLKIECLPYDDIDFSRVLDALITRDFVVKYVVDGVEYGFIPGFSEHQVINNRESASTLPEPNENNILTREARDNDASVTREVHAQAEGKGREGKGKEGDMSGKPDDVSLVIDYLNEKAGRQYTDCDANAKLVKARLKEHGIEDLKAVVDRKVEEWPPGHEMNKYLRPATLFNAEKFAQYYGELGTVITTDSGAPVAQWHETAPGIKTKGEELGIFEQDFDHFYQFKNAVFQAAGHTPDDKQRSGTSKPVSAASLVTH